MAGRFAHLVVAVGAVVGGMFIQDDLGDEIGDHSDRVAVVSGDEHRIEQEVDAMVDRAVDKIEVSEDGQAIEADPAAKRALAEAVAELVRAEGSLISAKLDEDASDEAIQQAEQRRDVARQTVEKLADDAKAASRGDRDALRQNIREQVREEVREAVRS